MSRLTITGVLACLLCTDMHHTACDASGAESVTASSWCILCTAVVQKAQQTTKSRMCASTHKVFCILLQHAASVHDGGWSCSTLTRRTLRSRGTSAPALVGFFSQIGPSSFLLLFCIAGGASGAGKAVHGAAICWRLPAPGARIRSRDRTHLHLHSFKKSLCMPSEACLCVAGVEEAVLQTASDLSRKSCPGQCPRHAQYKACHAGWRTTRLHINDSR